MNTVVVRLDRIASSVIAWTIILCLVGGLTVVAVVVMLPLYYRDRLRTRGAHQRRGR